MEGKNNSKYAEKKGKQKAGTYHGSSPLFNNISEFQHLKPLHLYPHLQQGGMRVPDPNRRIRIKQEDLWDLEG